MATRNTTTRDRHRKLVAAEQPPCWLCGDPIDYTLPHLDPRAFVVDHIVPLAKGGQDTLNNKRAAHRDCNRAKSDKLESPVIRRSRTLARRG
ncbi:MAG TPA: HNH endonuclease signature motif containing protein [Micropruina sp.]|nr:HNH endonuclease signature motif containing protein [Micropruina sp.]HMR20978.1 HNH endonuclease signature motif containing protein [Micropruina sp.]